MPLGSTRRPSIFAGIRARCRLVWFTWLALLGASTATAQQSYDIAMRDGLLSIRANGASVTELAAALAAETGINFVVTGNGGTPITADIVDEPFDRAVAKLSPNHLLVRDGKRADATVTEVILMLDDDDSGGSGDGGFLPSGAPADEIIGGELPVDEVQTDEPTPDAVPLEETPNGVDDGSTPDGSDPGYRENELPDDGSLPSR